MTLEQVIEKAKQLRDTMESHECVFVWIDTTDKPWYSDCHPGWFDEPRKRIVCIIHSDEVEYMK